MKLNPRSKRFLVVALAFIIIISILVINRSSVNFSEACINETCFQLEIAETAQEKSLGLSNRDFLPEAGGMLFPYPEGAIPGFWMKDMNFALDIIWINSNLEVSEIVRGIEPCEPDFCPVVYPSEEIVYVLEINGGLSDRYGFESGDFVKLK